MPFDLQPVLCGDLLGVRPLRSTDLDDLYQVASDPLIWEQHPIRDRYRRHVFTRFFAESLASGGALAVTSTAGNIIGSSRFHGHDEDAARSRSWTFLARSYWGGQANGQLKRLMLEHAFRYVEWVVFLVGPDNRRSQRALEKIGAVRAGARPDAAGQDSVLFELRRPPSPGASELRVLVIAGWRRICRRAGSPRVIREGFLLGDLFGGPEGVMPGLCSTCEMSPARAANV
jgi:RimJ/RimL family protein N-acetyltransferase